MRLEDSTRLILSEVDDRCESSLVTVINVATAPRRRRSHSIKKLENARLDQCSHQNGGFPLRYISAIMENTSRTMVPHLNLEIQKLFLKDEIRIIEPFLPKTMKDFNSSCS